MTGPDVDAEFGGGPAGTPGAAEARRAEEPSESLPSGIDRVTFNADGLVCAVAQQFDTLEVLMVAWMDRAALQTTLDTGTATYFSRSRGKQWIKGETSGHFQRVIEIRHDCDGDTLLLLVDQTGVACHTGSRTCFDGRLLSMFHRLDVEQQSPIG